MFEENKKFQNEEQEGTLDANFTASQIADLDKETKSR